VGLTSATEVNLAYTSATATNSNVTVLNAGGIFEERKTISGTTSATTTTTVQPTKIINTLQMREGTGNHHGSRSNTTSINVIENTLQTISGTTTATTTNIITPERISYLDEMKTLDIHFSNSNISRLDINTIENTLQVISGTTSATTKMSTVDGFLVESSIGGVVKRSSMGADEIITTGSIRATVISATTVMIDGVSLSACCEIDEYVTGASATGTWDWDISGNSTNFQITLAVASNTLNIDNVRNGEYATIIVNQDATGGRALTFGTINGSAGTHYVVNGGGGVPTLTATASATDILSFTYNGTAAFWTVGNDYT